MTAEWNVGMEIEVLIDPNHSGIKPTCNGVQWLRICTPNGGSKAIWRSVGQPDGFVEVLVLENGPQWSNVFSGYVSRFRRRIVQEGDGKKHAGTLRGNFPLIEDRSLRLLNFFPRCLHASELGAVLYRAESGLGIKSIAELLMLSTGYECFRKSLIDALVHEKPFEGDTPLATECEHASKQVFGDCLRIGIRKDNTGIVHAQLKRQVCQGGGGGCEDLASGCRRSCEGDLLEAWMGGHPGAKVIPAADHIQNAGRKDLTNVVGGSKYRKRSKDCRLQDHGVASQQSWEHFC